MEDIMAETKKNDLVRYKAFKDNDKYKDDITVIVNGKIWRIKRGEWVELPQYVIDVIEQGNDQSEAASKFAESKENEYKRASKVFE